MGTVARTAMHTDAQILTLAQWFSPAFPVGAFAYSHGLEWAISEREVTTVSDLLAWIGDVLSFGSGTSDPLFLAAAYRAKSPAEVAEIDQRCRSFAASGERLRETDLQGAAFCKVASDVWHSDLHGLTYPVAVGRAAFLADLPQTLTSQMFLQSFVSTLVSVGLRLVPLGQTDGQTLIRQFAPLCTEIATATKSGDLSMLSATSFLTDIASMKHETQHSRVFRT